MFRKKEKLENLDIENLNEVISLGKKILRVSYFLILLVLVISVGTILRDWNVGEFLLTIVTIISPLFIGFVIAWLFNPLVTWLQEKGVRRVIGAAIIYLIFFIILYLIISSIIPLLADQLNDFASNLPSVITSVDGFIDDTLSNFNDIEYVDVESVKTQILDSTMAIGNSITESIPDATISVISTLFSAVGITVLGLIIGFYLLVAFDSTSDNIIAFVPRRFRRNVVDMFNLINTSMFSYVKGALIDSTFVFIISTIGFTLIGLESPMLFGLFCGLTNVIPYAGPYIGGFPAVLIAFTQSPTTGILTLILIVIIQFLEGNFIQPLIMSKTTKLHPVTIILGLLVFGYFFGIIGMIISTPIIGSIKAIVKHFDKKYNLMGKVEKNPV